MVNDKQEKKYAILYLILALLLVFIFLFSFSVGRYTNIRVGEIAKIIINRLFGVFEKTWSIKDEAVVINMRLPRIIISIFVGAALAVAGSVYQGIFYNPIASPDTLGISNGASFGAVLGILLGFNTAGIKAMAFVSGIAAVCFVLLSAKMVSKGQSITLFLILIGMVVSSLFSASLSALKYLADPENQLPQITYWLMGSFGKVTNDDIISCVVLIALGIIPLFFMRWHLNMLSLSTEEAKSMGVNLTLIRCIAVMCATLLTAVSSALTGGVAWIGLIIPHISKMIQGNDFRKNMPLNILLGGIFMLVMDDLARSISANELPISILTSVVGAPIFFAIIVINRRKLSYDD